MSFSSFAGDVANGEKLWNSKKLNCAQCHGKKGEGKAATADKIRAMKAPKIAGCDEKYIAEQLKAIGTKARKTKYTAMMMSRVKKLSAKEYADLAAYVSKMGPAHKCMYQK